jgi:hypothetical protein
MPDLFTLISDISSILGLLLTICTLIYALLIDRRVKNFEKSVLFNTRIPILTIILKQHHSQLSKDLNAKDERKIRETINLCRTIVEDINPKLPTSLSRQGNKLKRKLKKQYIAIFELENEKTIKWKFWITVITMNKLWVSYDSLNSLITRIDNLQKDKKIIP